MASPQEPEHTPDPLVSVVTPSFDQARWLEDNLASVRLQDYPRLEHVVMDGGSTDGSLELLRSSSRPGLIWRSEADSGQADALNKAFRASSGEVIGWLNSDDAYFRTDAVSLAVDAFERHPEVDVVYGHAALVNSSGLVLQVLWTPRDASRLMRIHDFLAQPAVFVRRRALGEQLVDPAYDFMMDWELWLRLARHRRFHRVDRILAIDRHQPDRKVITRPDLAASDETQLRKTHRLYRSPIARPGVKVLKIFHRLAGVARVEEAAKTPLAFHGRIDSQRAILKRQLVTPRSRMSFE